MTDKETTKAAEIMKEIQGYTVIYHDTEGQTTGATGVSKKTGGKIKASNPAITLGGGNIGGITFDSSNGMITGYAYTDLEHKDPISGYMTEKQGYEAIEIEDILQGHVRHQTIVIVEASANSTATFRERAQRLVGGLNTAETIKANVVTITDGKMYAGLVFTGKESGGKEVKFPPGTFNLIVRISDKDLK